MTESQADRFGVSELTAGAEPAVGSIYGVRSWYASPVSGELCSPVLQATWTPGEVMRFQCRCWSYGEQGMVGDMGDMAQWTQWAIEGESRVTEPCPHPRIYHNPTRSIPTACGIHAYHWDHRERALDYACVFAGDQTEDHVSFYVVGVVKAWGHVVAGSQGFRAEYARVVAFFSVLDGHTRLNEDWADVPRIGTHLRQGDDTTLALQMFPELATPPT